MSPIPRPPRSQSPLAGRDLLLWLSIALAPGVLACDEEQVLTAPPAAIASAQAQDFAVAPSATDSATAMGTIALPINQSIATTAPAPAFRITQTGTGPNGGFVINRATNAQAALTASTNGTGGAGIFRITNQTSAATSLLGSTTGLGNAGQFQLTNAASRSHAIFAQTNGTRAAFRALTTGTGQAALFEIQNATNTAPVLYAQTSGRGGAGLFQVTNSSNAEPALTAEHVGSGPGLSATSRTGSAGLFSGGGNSVGGAPVLQVRSSRTNTAAGALSVVQTGSGKALAVVLNNTSSGETALSAGTNGLGFAASFNGAGATSNGVHISTPSGSTGLVVVGGTKNAAVSTPTGMRVLYTEESTEVWFTDYGFGRLDNGRARILIDPSFAQTVSLDEPYHVFVQPYGRAELYIEETTSLGFVVMLKDGDPNAKFGYRVVAKRQGFETQRLERAPRVDNSPGFDTRSD
jgi:hypothetical protein